MAEPKPTTPDPPDDSRLSPQTRELFEKAAAARAESAKLIEKLRRKRDHLVRDNPSLIPADCYYLL
jgi:hypothetical protein